MNPGGCEGVPTSTLIMPFLNMFKSRRERSTSLPRAQDRYLHDEVYNQPSAYGPRSNSGLNRSAHPTLHHTGSRAQRNPPYGSSYSNSGPERYAESSISNDQSWYRVEHPDDDHRSPYGRDPDQFSYSEEGSRHSDVSGTGVPAHAISESTGLSSPVPTVYRQGSPAQGSRMFEQFASPAVPASVTRLDLHDGLEDAYGGGFDRPRRGSRPPPVHSGSLHRNSQNHHRNHPPHRQPSQRAFQGPAHVPLASDSSRSDVMQMLENGDRVPIPRLPLERRRLPPQESYGQGSKLKRTYYVVPPGMSVIFRDENGNELKRVGDFSSGGNPPDMYDEAPIELTDEHGRIVYRTGLNYTDDGSDINEAALHPKVVHLGQYVSNGSAIPRSTSPITVSLDRRGYHRQIHLDHSVDGSFGGSQGSSDLSYTPPLSHTRSEGNLAGLGPGSHRSHNEKVRLRTVYP